MSAELAVERSRSIFIHACWRTGSTYVWAKYRHDPRFWAYLEPLHEALHDAREARFEEEHAQEVTRALRHPDLNRHYFAEYPFRAAGGVDGFRKHLSYERYCLEEDDEDEALEAYLALLIARARERGRVPVLQFNRALLRSRWLARRFAPTSVLLLRRPVDVWASFRSFPHVHFFVVLSCIFGQNGDHPLLRPLRELVQVPCFRAETFAEEYDFYCRFVDGARDRLYPVFYYFSVLTFLYNLPVCAVIADLTLASERSEARREIERALARCGARISLDDCALPTSDAAGSDVPERSAIERDVHELLRENAVVRLAPEVVRAALPLVSVDLQRALLAVATEGAASPARGPREVSAASR